MAEKIPEELLEIIEQGECVKPNLRKLSISCLKIYLKLYVLF